MGDEAIDFRRLGEDSSDLIIALDARFRYIYVNPQVERLAGTSRENLLGRDIWEFAPHTRGTVYDENYRRAMRERTVIEFEAYYPPLDRWNHVRCVPEAGGGIIVFARDTSHMHRAEEAREKALQALQASERQARRAVRVLYSVYDAYVTLDRDFRITYINAAAARINAKPAEAFLGKSHWEEWPASVGSEVERRYRQVMETRVPAHFIHRYVVAGEYDVWLDISVYPAGEEDGGGLHLVYRDISSQKLAEEALAQSAVKLRASEERLRLATEAANVGAWDYNPLTGELFWDERCKALFGLPPDTEVDYETFLSGLHDEDRDHVHELNQQALRGENDGIYETEYRTVGLIDGAVRWVEAKGRALADEDGRIVRYVGTMLDTTDKKQAQTMREAFAEQQRRTAETLQRSLLLAPEAGAFPGVDVHAIYEAAWDEAEVGGDFFDTLALDGGRVALVVGDVTGKGLTAATFTAEIKFALRTLLREHDGDPAVALQRLNRHLIAGQKLDGKSASVFVCLAVAVIDPHAGEAAFSVAGAEPPLIMRAATGKAEELPLRALMLGAMPDWQGSSVVMNLAVGDLLLMFTDGLTEARRGFRREDFFDAEGVEAALRKALPLGALPAIGSAIIDSAKEFAEGSLGDDVCLLLARLISDSAV